MHTQPNGKISRTDNFSLTPGQGMGRAIEQPAWHNKVSPYTPISLLDDQVLEFTIKACPQHEGVTDNRMIDTN